MRTRTKGAAVVCMTLLTLFGGHLHGHAQETALPVAVGADPWIIDTDMGREDWLALLLALGHPRADIRAITVVGDGVGRCPSAAAAASAIVARATADKQDVAVACGARFPLDGFHAMPPAWRDAAEPLRFGLAPLLDAPPNSDSADDLIIATLKEADRPVSILTLGPLTNIALAIDKAPDVLPNIREIVMMGGAVHAAGNVGQVGASTLPTNSTSEWNFFLDPVAADLVLRSGVAIRMVPLDATRFVPVDERLAGSMLSGMDSAAARLAEAVIESLLEAERVYFWDPLAASVAMDRAVCDYQMAPVKLAIDVAAEGWSYPGTATDFPATNWNGAPRRHLATGTAGAITRDPDNGIWVFVCSRPDVAAFVDSFRKSLSGQPMPSSGVPMEERPVWFGWRL